MFHADSWPPLVNLGGAQASQEEKKRGKKPTKGNGAQFSYPDFSSNLFFAAFSTHHPIGQLGKQLLLFLWGQKRSQCTKLGKIDIRNKWYKPSLGRKRSFNNAQIIHRKVLQEKQDFTHTPISTAWNNPLKSILGGIFLSLRYIWAFYSREHSTKRCDRFGFRTTTETKNVTNPLLRDELGKITPFNAISLLGLVPRQSIGQTNGYRVPERSLPTFRSISDFGEFKSNRQSSKKESLKKRIYIFICYTITKMYIKCNTDLS